MGALVRGKNCVCPGGSCHGLRGRECLRLVLACARVPAERNVELEMGRETDHFPQLLGEGGESGSQKLARYSGGRLAGCDRIPVTELGSYLRKVWGRVAFEEFGGIGSVSRAWCSPGIWMSGDFPRATREICWLCMEVRIRHPD